MVRAIFLILITLTLNANELEQNCLKCHIKNQLPTNLIYKRYLMKYSTKNNMKTAIFNYLKNPKIQNSIMPKQFFIKFKIKNNIKLDDKTLKRDIDLFLEKYDIKKRLK
jgi:hypothetical protein